MRIALLVATGSLVGCAAGGHARDQPARLTVGVTARHFAATGGETSPSTFRTTDPLPTSPPTRSHQATLATVAFTMPSHYGSYFGGEVETGVLDTPGATASAAYAVAGLGGSLGRINLAAELVAGRRWLRFATTDDDLARTVLEPRLRADLWLTPQLSFGATTGRTLGDQEIWMAGVFLAIHSHPFGP